MHPGTAPVIDLTCGERKSMSCGSTDGAVLEITRNLTAGSHQATSSSLGVVSAVLLQAVQMPLPAAVESTSVLIDLTAATSPRTPAPVSRLSHSVSAYFALGFSPVLCFPTSHFSVTVDCYF